MEIGNHCFKHEFPHILSYVPETIWIYYSNVTMAMLQGHDKLSSYGQPLF